MKEDRTSATARYLRRRCEIRIPAQLRVDNISLNMVMRRLADVRATMGDPDRADDRLRGMWDFFTGAGPDGWSGTLPDRRPSAASDAAAVAGLLDLVPRSAPFSNTLTVVVK